MKLKKNIIKIFISTLMVLLSIPVINVSALDLKDIVTMQLSSLLEKM
ncbi:hypothetical protein [Massilimicrobiota timonensis]|nr:hypothetical protein [Massilimicrobiota timonensis]